MDCLRAFFRLSFFLFLTIFSINAVALPETGIAFIHGTNDHRLDAEGVYWQKDFIADIASALPNPDNVFVVKCDFTHFMWEEDAAGCVASQLLGFIQLKKIDQLTVYTHSNGGNVIRFILSHPTYDARFYTLSQQIKEVIALAPSSGGTYLSDMVMNGTAFEEGVGWLLGYRSPSVKQQRVRDMALFNHEILLGTAGRATLPVPFRVIVGTDVTASPINSASYCNGYFKNAALKVTQLYLAACSDGFLDCTSQAAAGTVWFYDWDKLENKTNLSHNQSRHGCFGLDAILKSDLVKQGEHA